MPFYIFKKPPMDYKKIKEVFGVFLKLGCIAFGGPAAHIAMMEEELVNKRKWMTRQHFLDMIGATNLVPGPNSTQMTMHCGHVRAGWAGLIAGGIGFITPAVLFTLLVAIFYTQYGNLYYITPIFSGIKPAVIGIIFSATYKLGKKAFKNWQLILIGSFVCLLSIVGFDEFVLIFLGGVFGILLLNPLERFTKINFIAPLWLLLKPITLAIGNQSIFFVFLKITLVLFGSGYVLIAYIDAELVEKLSWLSKTELIDAIAMGQFTPGPILTTATFVGYQLNGLGGAIWATVGIFLPSFVLVAFLVKLIPILRKSKKLSLFLDGLNASAVGIMIAVTLKLSIDMIANWQTTIIMLSSILVIIIKPKLSAIWIVLGGGFLGWLTYFIPSLI